MFTPLNDWDLIRKLVQDSSIKITHEGNDGRLISDIKEALEFCFSAYEDIKDEKEYQKELSTAAEKQIIKLEKMLVKRGAKFKKWTSVKEDSGFY